MMELLFIMLVCIVSLGFMSIYFVIKFDKITRAQELIIEKQEENFLKN